MKKRSISIGDYNTADYGWTLSGLALEDATYKSNYVEKPGGDGTWDFSTVLSGGIPRYENRTLTATLELSKGTRDDREKIINDLVNQHDGLERDIILPDRPDHYIHGRVQVAVLYSDLAHASVTITATCEPWFYAAREKQTELTVTAEEQTVDIYNCGRRATVPVLTVAGKVHLTFSGAELDLGEDLVGGMAPVISYKWPHMVLMPGCNSLTYSGNGAATITFREAVLR